MLELSDQEIQGSVLVVDDDPDQRWLIENFLGDKGYRVHTAEDGSQMWDQVGKHEYDLVIMDVGLPGKDGFNLTRELREKLDIGIIMVTAANDLVDRVLGLELGADDYLAKPFELRELHARLKSVLRRKSSNTEATDEHEEEPLYEFDTYCLDTKQFLITNSGKPCFMEPKCLDLLILILRNRDRVVGKEEILKAVWAGRIIADSTLSTLVKQLRRSLGDSGKEQRLIRTVHGRGYQFIGEVVCVGRQ